ncbi:aldehyde dehydrogenase iron-sulfur subunit PaoA [Croceicoccus bisphenolivorans]|uniref:aldehyde dehydrogenase iron-sulfur subunit PaoA n=1 Tax=Croceicoccus bisphenolivorans TaxID=1783232 RepID=UPI00082EECF0|nr:aldehyde dehydrogenase iron-sulfur subunit PaoA [Croceicoccus bisphenolivorans]
MSAIGPDGMTRRGVLATGAVTAAMTATNARARVTGAKSDPAAGPTPMPLTFEVNGKLVELSLDPRTTLLDALREHLRLTGTKKGCDHGQCGACTVIVNGQRINSCLSLALMHEGDAVTTIEGLGTPDDLHPMQAAFVEHDGFQCGYCTPGQICSAVSVLQEIAAGVPSHVTGDITGKIAATRAEMTERMSGNLCRCGAYANIADAMTQIAEAQS